MEDKDPEETGRDSLRAQGEGPLSFWDCRDKSEDVCTSCVRLVARGSCRKNPETSTVSTVGIQLVLHFSSRAGGERSLPSPNTPCLHVPATSPASSPLLPQKWTLDKCVVKPKCPSSGRQNSRSLLSIGPTKKQLQIPFGENRKFEKSICEQRDESGKRLKSKHSQ